MKHSSKDPIIQYENKKVYPPSDDSFLIVDYFRKVITNSTFDGYNIKNVKYILDMGTGTGIVAIFLQVLASQLSNFNPKIYASDILKEAIICAKNNEKINNLKGEINFIHSDLFKSFPKKSKHKFNVIIFNPPYLPALEIKTGKSSTDTDYSWNGGQEGYETLVEFFNQVDPFLNPDHNAICLLYFITSSRVNRDKIINILLKLGFQTSIIAKKHIFFEDIILNRSIRPSY